MRHVAPSRGNSSSLFHVARALVVMVGLFLAVAAHGQTPATATFTPTVTPTPTYTPAAATADVCSFGAVQIGTLRTARKAGHLTGVGPIDVIDAPGAGTRIYLLDVEGSVSGATTGGLYAAGGEPLYPIDTSGAATLPGFEYAVPLCLPANTALTVNQSTGGTIHYSVGYAIGSAEATPTPWPTRTLTPTPH